MMKKYKYEESHTNKHQMIHPILTQQICFIIIYFNNVKCFKMKTMVHLNLHMIKIIKNMIQ